MMDAEPDLGMRLYSTPRGLRGAHSACHVGTLDAAYARFSASLWDRDMGFLGPGGFGGVVDAFRGVSRCCLTRSLYARMCEILFAGGGATAPPDEPEPPAAAPRSPTIWMRLAAGDAQSSSVPSVRRCAAAARRSRTRRTPGSGRLAGHADHASRKLHRLVHVVFGEVFGSSRPRSTRRRWLSPRFSKNASTASFRASYAATKRRARASRIPRSSSETLAG
mmetsp:Transcript_5506/g.16929  ORF Transcript_5506/g.16929 Transcript_5506/m.16929 type:complete len:221 (+) Transcript_5506:1037-1699(+)